VFEHIAGEPKEQENVTEVEAVRTTDDTEIVPHDEKMCLHKRPSLMKRQTWKLN